jgi:hypothetical protein
MAFIIIIALLIVGCVTYLVAGVQLHKKSLTPSNIVEEAKNEIETVETKIEAKIEAEIETVVETVKPKVAKKAKPVAEKATSKKVTKKK